MFTVTTFPQIANIPLPEILTSVAYQMYPSSIVVAYNLRRSRTSDSARLDCSLPPANSCYRTAMAGRAT